MMNILSFSVVLPLSDFCKIKENITTNMFFHMKRIIFITVALLQFGFSSCQQPGRKIEIEIKGAQDSVMYLVHYYGNSNSIADTAVREKSGKFIFSGKQKLPEGVYILVDEHKSKPYFEFLIDDQQQFKVKSDTVDLYGNLEFTNSPSNTAFRNYSLYIMESRKTAEGLRAQIKAIKDGENQAEQGKLEELETALKKIDLDVKAHQRDLVAKDPKSMLSLLMKLQWDPEHPYDLKHGTRDDSLKAFYYTKNHYWDYVDLSDERIVRTPIFHEKLKTFLTVLVVQHPDSVIMEGEKIIAQTVASPELFKYVVWYTVNMTERSNIMGMEAAFVHFAKAYYLAGKTWWASEPVLKKMGERVTTLERILIGVKTPELQMWDTNKVVTSLYQTRAAFTILLFWDYECGHCNKMMPGLVEYYNTVKNKGVEVFAVCTKTDLEKWKKYIHDKNMTWVNVNGGYSINRYDTLYDILATPIIFLLDKDKKIIAKKIELDQLKEILKIEMERTQKSEGMLRKD
jgi:thiol-disulfide isomerase/thioredoxin